MSPESLLIPSPNYTTPAPGTRAVRAIVLHSTESRETAGAARAVARNWFARPDARASAHYVVDNAEIIQCVPEHLIAWHARGFNRHSVGVELVGRADQGASGWADDYSIAVLELAARLCASICQRHSLDARELASPAVAAIVRQGHATTGITTHASVSAAGLGMSDHWDPGPAFPMEWFLERVRWRIKMGLARA